MTQRATMLSFGAGVQTTALLVLCAEGAWPLRPDAVVFADTGDEKEATYRYLSEVAEPYAHGYGMEIVTLGPEWRAPQYSPDLETYSLGRHMVPGTFTRWCTARYKVDPLARYRKRVLGATKAKPVEAWIGISLDEARRAKDSIDPTEIKRYPLIELGLSRQDCAAVIERAGLPVPPKSGCWFCPFMRRGQWQQLKREQPELFARALAMERNAKPHAGGRPRYLPLFGSLEAVASQNEMPGFDALIEAEGGCVSGACFV